MRLFHLRDDMKNTRDCMSDRIREEITSRILSGALQPGDRLVELDLAREFDTSQTPVREALRELETSRLVESIPYRGTRVRAISDREMLEAYSVRGVLEQFAAELAAPYFQNNTVELRAFSEAVHQAARDGDYEAYGRENTNFHRLIVDRSDNELLIQSWLALAFDTRVRIHLARVVQLDLPDRAREHDAIVDALDVGDGILAGRLLREHSESCKSRWLNRQRGAAAAGTEAPATVQAVVLS